MTVRRYRLRPRGLLVAMGLALSPSDGAAQTVRGLLVEREGGRPVAGTVHLVTEDGDTVGVAASNVEGFFSLAAPEPGAYSVVGSAFGYVRGVEGPFELEEGTSRVVYVRMDPAPIPVEGIDVEAYDPLLVREGFYDRMREGEGQFLTPADVAASEERLTPGLFFGLDYVIPDWSAAPWDRWVTLSNPWGKGTCNPRVFVDGVWINRPGYERYGEGWSLDTIVRRRHVKAAELYWASGAPARFTADLRADERLCGVVVIWTKFAGR